MVATREFELKRGDVLVLVGEDARGDNETHLLRASGARSWDGVGVVVAP